MCFNYFTFISFIPCLCSFMKHTNRPFPFVVFVGRRNTGFWLTLSYPINLEPFLALRETTTYVKFDLWGEWEAAMCLVRNYIQKEAFLNLRTGHKRPMELKKIPSRGPGWPLQQLPFTTLYLGQYLHIENHLCTGKKTRLPIMCSFRSVLWKKCRAKTDLVGTLPR